MLILRTCQAISTLPERISATTKSANQRHARSLALACWRTSHSQSTDTSGMMHSVAMLFVLGTLVTCSFGAHSAISDLPNVTSSGHLTLQKSDGSEMFYAYYESKTPATQATPVLLWLQNLFELGPSWVNSSLQLVDNPGSWNREAGLLFIDQPVGSGFSKAGSRGIPTDETQIATDLYDGLQAFFAKHEDLQNRPFFITGESYAGKYVPAIGHYILEMEELYMPRQSAAPLQVHQPIPQLMMDLGPPLFQLKGLAIGNGLTDPQLQVLTHADTCHAMGLIDEHERVHAMEVQIQVASMISQGQWQEASRQRELLLAYLQQQSGAGTMLDTRRTRDYDADKLVEQYLNRRDVQEALGVKLGSKFVGCSDKVAAALGPDVMKTVKPLIPDLLAALPVLLYQGQFDAQDGPGSVEAWTTNLNWPGRFDFYQAKRHIWRLGQDALQILDSDDVTTLQAEPASGEDVKPVAGYIKHHHFLTSVVLKDAGHMVPRDQPEVAQTMIESWLQHSLKAGLHCTIDVQTE